MIELQQQLRQQQEDQTEALADLNDWMGDIAKKEEALKKKTKMAPDLPPIRGSVPVPAEKVSAPAPKEDPVARFKDLGNDYFKKGKYKEAVDNYTKGITLDPKGFDTHVLYGNRGMAYLNLNMWKESEVDSTVSVELNRTYTKGYFRRGTARVQLGKLREALEDFERVIVLEPTNTDAQAQISIVKSRLPAPVSAANAATPAGAPARKKLVVQEVDDDDDEPAPPAPLTQTQLDAHAQVEAARRAQEESKKKQAELVEKQRASQRKTNSRVEEIEDEEEVIPPPRKVPVAKAHVPVAPRVVELPQVTLDKLKTPKTFLEFEGRYNDIAQQANKDTLFPAYFQLLPKGSLKAFFKSNMTSDILTEILLACNSVFETPYALGVLQELLTVSRADDLLMFSEAKEKIALKGAFDKIMESASVDKAVAQKVMTAYKDIVPF